MQRRIASKKLAKIETRDARRATLQLGDSRSKIVAASKPASTHKTFGVVARDSALLVRRSVREGGWSAPNGFGATGRIRGGELDAAFAVARTRYPAA